MSLNPFHADAGRRRHYETLKVEIGSQVRDEILSRAATGNGEAASNLGSVLPAADATALLAQFGLDGVEDLMVLGLDAAERLARPSISGFHVGSIGLEQETGNLILGGNVEFEGTSLGFTLHGEGFIFARAFSRGTTVSVLSIGEAHPCAHCRQFLSEFAATSSLRLIDPLGHDLSMAQLYPWPFDPDYLGESGIIVGAVPYPDLAFGDDAPAEINVSERLLHAGRRAHAPYGKCPAAVVLRLQDGTLFAGSTIESVSFNPTIGPLQAAIVDLLAHGRRYEEIAKCWLGAPPDGPVRLERTTRELLNAIAPQAELTIVAWRP